MHRDKECRHEVKQGIQLGLSSLRKVTMTRVICDKNMPVKLMGEMYGTVIRPPMLYWLETVTTTAKQEASL